jgi:hypothetical protein
MIIVQLICVKYVELLLLNLCCLVCQSANSMEHLLQLSLTAEEERHLVDYLKNGDSPFTRDLLVLYYLQHSKIVDAIRINSYHKMSSVRFVIIDFRF